MMPVDRIDRMIDLIREIWHQYPDLRLYQLLGDASYNENRGHDPYYYEDDDLEADLQAMYLK